MCANENCILMCCYLTYKYLMQYSITAAWQNHGIKKLSFICNPKEKPSRLEPSQITEGEQNLLITKHIALRVPFNKFNGYSKFWFFCSLRPSQSLISYDPQVAKKLLPSKVNFISRFIWYIGTVLYRWRITGGIVSFATLYLPASVDLWVQTVKDIKCPS